jgi:CO/xanthine dehydrogenase Mo-binding subunit
VGGGFGGKLDPFPDTICAAKLSMLTGKPVKITLSREEVFYNHRGRHPSLMWMNTGLQDGRIAAMHFKAFIDGGAYSSFGTAAAYYHGALQPVTYKIPNYKVEIVRFYTNKPACGPKRGHGTPQPRFALESHIDKLAEDIGTDPHEFRLQNLIEPFSTTVNQLRVTTCALDVCMKKVVDGSEFFKRRGSLPHGRGVGLAVGAYLCGAALPIYWNDMPHSEVLIKADRSGTITVYSGHTEIGQGADTVLAYIVAERLGIEPEHVALVLRDSDSVPPDLGSYSSRVTMMMGNAACDAVDKLRDVLLDACAEALQVERDDLVLAQRRVSCRSNPDQGMSLEEAIGKAEARHGALSFSGSYTPSVQYGDFKGGGVGPSPAYSYSASVVEVDVDLDTGFVRPRKVWIAHDIGKCINRQSVEGQVEGGVYMALGEVMMEEMLFTKTGQLKNAGLLDYKTPTIREMPDIEVYIVEDPDANGPFGAKEVGQGPLLPVVPAFANAVYDAIGVRFDEIPITPDKVYKALESGNKRHGPTRIIDFPFPEPVRVDGGADVKT